MAITFRVLGLQFSLPRVDRLGHLDSQAEEEDQRQFVGDVLRAGQGLAQLHLA